MAKVLRDWATCKTKSPFQASTKAINAPPDNRGRTPYVIDAGHQVAADMLMAAAVIEEQAARIEELEAAKE